ncbi:MAG: LiaF transmembrane domain-containing protein [Clostridium sp.]
MKKKNIFLGLILILAGILLVLIDLKGFSMRDTIDIVLGVILIGIFIEGIIRRNFYGIIIPLAGVYAIGQNYFNIYKLNIVTILLVAILFSVGLSIMFKKEKTMIKQKERLDINYDVKAKANFGSAITYVTDDFNEGAVECSFGAVQMYFDKDNIKNDEGILYINSVCSGVELYVPKEWRVMSEINNIFSGINEEGVSLSEKKAVLRLVGISKLSGITIKYI